MKNKIICAMLIFFICIIGFSQSIYAQESNNKENNEKLKSMVQNHMVWLHLY